MHHPNLNRREEQPEGYGPGAPSGPGALPPASPPPPPYYAPPLRPDPRLKSPVLAGFLSALFPGLGPIYIGYYQRGVSFALTLAAIITALASGSVHGLEPLFGIAIGFTYFLGIVDAIRLGHLYNQVVMGQPGSQLPDGMKLPKERGSYAGGIVLVLLGVLIFLNRNFDFSLEWLADWWPLGVIGLGVWLIVKARRGRREEAGA